MGAVGPSVVARVQCVPGPAVGGLAASGDQHRQEQDGDDGEDDDGER
ncbi:MAG: hypothetical protein JST59_14710 [Actinobacteria bacterium]|nr:hypothetical protein [Actinomycetota bacterium]